MIRKMMVVLASVWLSAGSAAAAVEVVATVPDLGSIAALVGGDLVNVEVLCPGEMDPHFLPAKPSLARKLGKADLLLFNGLELEIGWLPQLINKARNPDVKPGAPGNVDCSFALTEILDVPAGGGDRGGGDIHPLGNPHYSHDPRRMAEVAALIADKLAAVDPANSGAYRSRADAFANEIARRLPGWEAMTRGAAGIPIIAYHSNWAYLNHWLGLDIVGEIEHRPGIAPSPRHVQELIGAGRERDSLIVVAATWDHLDIVREVCHRAQGEMVVLPGQTGALPEAGDYFGLIDTICSRLETAARNATRRATP